MTTVVFANDRFVIKPRNYDSSMRMDVDPNQTVFTDGSVVTDAYGNKMAGMGIVVVNSESADVISIAEKTDTDINVVEAKAILTYLRDIDDDVNRHLKFVVDTQTVMSRIWQEYQGIPVIYRTKISRRIQRVVKDIVDILVYKRNECTTFAHIYSHQGIYGNELADEAARDGTEIWRDGYMSSKHLSNCLCDIDI